MSFGMPGKLKRPESLTELVVKEIRTRIIEGALQLGETLSENALAQDLGISKTPVRDALQRLRAERLVDILPSRGTVVFSIGPAELDQLSEYRAVLESSAARLSMETDAKRFGEDLVRILGDMETALDRDDLATYRHLDADFHRSFFTHSGNKYVQAAYTDVEVQIQALRTRLSIDRQHITASFEEHRDIAALAKAGRADDVVNAVQAHADNTRRSFKAIVERLGGIS